MTFSDLLDYVRVNWRKQEGQTMPSTASFWP